MDKCISDINKYLKIAKVDQVIQRIAWAIMTIFLILGLLGIWGDSDGPLNQKVIALNKATVLYDQFLRVEKNTKTSVSLLQTDGNCTISFNKDYLDHVQIIQVSPEPELVEINDNRIIYNFKSLKAGTITFFKNPTKMGNQYLDLEVNGEKSIVSQYIYF